MFPLVMWYWWCLYPDLHSVRCWSIPAAAERRWSCVSWLVCVCVSAVWRTWTGWASAWAGPEWRCPAHWRPSPCAYCPSSLLRWPGTWVALPAWHSLYTLTLTRGNEGEWTNTLLKKCYFSEWKTFKHTVELLISFKLFFWALITLNISYLDALEHYWDCKLYYNNNDNDYRLYQSDTQDYIRLVPV